MSKVRVLFSENNITFDGTAPETYMQGLPVSVDSSDMTLSMWINPISPWISGMYGDMCLMSLGFNSYSDSYFNWKLSGYQSLQYYEGSGTADYSSVISWMADWNSLIDWGVPTHVAMVKRGNVGTFYINGQVTFRYTPWTSAPGLNITNQDFVIGGCPSEYGWAGSANNFRGEMDTIRMFQGAMETWQLTWLVDPLLYVHDSNDLAMLDARFVLTHNALLGRRKTMAAAIAKTPAARAVDDPNDRVIFEGDMGTEIGRRGLQTTDNTVEVPFTLAYEGVATPPSGILSYVSAPDFATSFASSFAQFMQYSPDVQGVNVVATVFPVASVAIPTAKPSYQPTPSPPPTPPIPYKNICKAAPTQETNQMPSYEGGGSPTYEGYPTNEGGSSPTYEGMRRLTTLVRQNCSQYNYVVDTVAGAVPSSMFVPYYPAFNDDYFGHRQHRAGYTTTAPHPGSTGKMVIV